MVSFEKFENESEEDYKYRMIGSADIWIYEIQDPSELPDGFIEYIWKMYLKIMETPIDELIEEYYDNIYCDDYRSNTLGGAWCRLWCRLARNEIDKRKQSNN